YVQQHANNGYAQGGQYSVPNPPFFQPHQQRQPYLIRPQDEQRQMNQGTFIPPQSFIPSQPYGQQFTLPVGYTTFPGYPVTSQMHPTSFITHNAPPIAQYPDSPLIPGNPVVHYTSSQQPPSSSTLQSTIPSSSSTITGQIHSIPPPSAQESTAKRQKKPLLIVDPNTKENVIIEQPTEHPQQRPLTQSQPPPIVSSSGENPPEPSPSNPDTSANSTDQQRKIRADFASAVGKTLAQPTSPPLDKPYNPPGAPPSMLSAPLNEPFTNNNHVQSQPQRSHPSQAPRKTSLPTQEHDQKRGSSNPTSSTTTVGTTSPQRDFSPVPSTSSEPQTKVRQQPSVPGIRVGLKPDEKKEEKENARKLSEPSDGVKQQQATSTVIPTVISNETQQQTDKTTTVIEPEEEKKSELPITYPPTSTVEQSQQESETFKQPSDHIEPVTEDKTTNVANVSEQDDQKPTDETGTTDETVTTPSTGSQLQLESVMGRSSESHVDKSNTTVDSTDDTQNIQQQEAQSTFVSDSSTTPPPTPPAPLSTQTSQQSSRASRLRYDRQQLLELKNSQPSMTKPDSLPNIEVVLSRPQPSSRSQMPHDTQYHDSQERRGPPRAPGIYVPGRGSGVGMGSRTIQIPKDDKLHKVDDPYRPLTKTQLDATAKVMRDIRSTLNKLTPQTFDKLQKQLSDLEINQPERLRGMIDIFFAKAVDEPGFSFLYAKLCKLFQKKQVTVPDDGGKSETYYFRQILLTRCQKEFENDYRQEIRYDERNVECSQIQDVKKRKEEQEKLDEDLAKAKRKKLGNIFFIGELFKLQMLTDTIMYDCVDYLLRDKTDEEALECLSKLLTTIGKELEQKASEKPANKTNLEKHYSQLEGIVSQRHTSARIRFMIQDLLDLRRANWVARRVEAKPMTIDEIHEQERVKRESQAMQQDLDRQQRRLDNQQGGNQGQRGSQQQGQQRGSMNKQRSMAGQGQEDEPRFNVSKLLQNNRNTPQTNMPTFGPAGMKVWGKGSGLTDKQKQEDQDQRNNQQQPFANRGKPPTGSGGQSQVPSQFTSSNSKSAKQSPSPYGLNQGNPLARQSSRELALGNRDRDRESAVQSLKHINTLKHSQSQSNSREGSRNVSREQSRNPSRDSSLSESRISTTKPSTPLAEQASSSTIPKTPESPLTEDKIKQRVHSLIEEYTENYSDRSVRPVEDAIEDLTDFHIRTSSDEELVVRELITNVLELKPRAMIAVGHLLDSAQKQQILSVDGITNGILRVLEIADDLSVDIPLVWQYIGEIIGTYVGSSQSQSTTNISIVKTIMQTVPDDKSKKMIADIIKYAQEFSSKSKLISLWQLSGLTFEDLLKPPVIDQQLLTDYDWLLNPTTTTPDEATQQQSFVATNTPHSDPHLVKLFRSVNELQVGSSVQDQEINKYIQDKMDPSDKYYIRNIVLSYLEACLVTRDPNNKKINEDVAKKRMAILSSIIQHEQDKEIQAVYAIQNFITKLEHPSKMARLLFDIFYDEECVSEDAFLEWRNHPDQSEINGHSVLTMSTKDFFDWLSQAETETEQDQEDE
ncbi:unnamed protein product, partial [Didymodactylos carnosus]